jgi:hypothetical protein
MARWWRKSHKGSSIAGSSPTCRGQLQLSVPTPNLGR